MNWQVAVSPIQSPGGARVVTVADAYITAFAAGPDTAAGESTGWISGAVYDARGDIVRESQRGWNGDRAKAKAVDPPHVTRDPGAHALDGAWLYGGHFAVHFGHFLLECLPNLWPSPEPDLKGVVFHRRIKGDAPVPGAIGLRRPRLRPWQTELLRLADYGDAKFRVVTGRPLVVERLTVATRPVLLKKWVMPEVVDLWERIAGHVEPGAPVRRVYLSRRRFLENGNTASKHARMAEPYERELEQAFERAGFAVVHPEQLSISAQIALVRGAEVIAGPSGSALHLSAFATSQTRVVELGDKRAPLTPGDTQRSIDAARGRLTAFVPYRDRDTLTSVLDSLP